MFHWIGVWTEWTGPSFASQKGKGGDNIGFIECKASAMIPSKLTLADNGEKVSEDSSNADAVVWEHEQEDFIENHHPIRAGQWMLDLAISKIHSWCG